MAAAPDSGMGSGHRDPGEDLQRWPVGWNRSLGSETGSSACGKDQAGSTPQKARVAARHRRHSPAAKARRPP